MSGHVEGSCVMWVWGDGIAQLAANISSLFASVEFALRDMITCKGLTFPLLTRG